jgi:hypothetical protein
MKETKQLIMEIKEITQKKARDAGEIFIERVGNN